MARTKMQARCSECGHSEARWLGRCPGCGAWGSMGEESRAPSMPHSASPAGQAVPIAQVPVDDARRAPTGLAEFDRVLGGGLVAGSVTLLSGEPGAGKSTLLLQAAHALASSGLQVLYVSAEESPAQVRLRAERLGTLHPRLLLASETDVTSVLALVHRHAPDLLIVDSIQTVRDPQVPGAPGGVAQVRGCAAELVDVAKRRAMATLLVGHVTKDGQVAGPRVLEHLVDAVCELAGDRHHALRLLRATKNRFGAAGEIGCFEMAGRGLRGVEDAGRLFVGEAPQGTAGVAVTLALEGLRPLACEVQALVIPTSAPNPRRVASGVDLARLHLLLAVIERRAGLELSGHEVYASSVGGVRLVEPAVDLALCLAVASACTDRSVSREFVILGEVGLAGEVRLVAQIERRLAEAARLGFSTALVPSSYSGADAGLRVLQAPTLEVALRLALS